MNDHLLDDYPDSDLLQSIDDGVGQSIEKTIQRFLPRDIAREVRKETVKFIAGKIKPKEETVEEVKPVMYSKNGE